MRWITFVSLWIALLSACSRPPDREFQPLINSIRSRTAKPVEKLIHGRVTSSHGVSIVNGYERTKTFYEIVSHRFTTIDSSSAAILEIRERVREFKPDGPTFNANDPRSNYFRTSEDALAATAYNEVSDDTYRYVFRWENGKWLPTDDYLYPITNKRQQEESHTDDVGNRWETITTIQ